MKILQRYILRELLLNFAFALTVITSVFFIAVSVQTLYRFPELSFLFVLQILPHFVPYSLAYTVPMSAMIGVVLTYGRLSADNEITAMRTSGMHLSGILVPGLLLGVLTIIVCFVLQANVIPYCQYMKRRVTRDAIARFFSSLDTATKVSLGSFRMSWESRDEEGRFIKLQLTLSDFEGGPSQKLIADKGILNITDGRIRFDLYGAQGLIHRNGSFSPSVPPPPENPSDETETPVGPGEIPPELELDQLVPGADVLSFSDRSQVEASSQANRTFPVFGHIKWELEIDTLLPSSKDKRRLREFPLADLMAMGRSETDEVRKAEIDTQVQQRFSLSCAGLSFILIGMPLGVLFRRGNRLVAFLVSFLLVMTLYYPLLMFGEAFGETNRLHPALAMWSANIVLGGLGLGMIAHVLRH